jgi:hypothetical protein
LRRAKSPINPNPKNTVVNPHSDKVGTAATSISSSGKTSPLSGNGGFIAIRLMISSPSIAIVYVPGGISLTWTSVIEGLLVRVDITNLSHSRLPEGFVLTNVPTPGMVTEYVTAPPYGLRGAVAMLALSNGFGAFTSSGTVSASGGLNSGTVLGVFRSSVSVSVPSKFPWSASPSQCSISNISDISSGIS